jgi:hypothetical protein
MGQTRAQAIRGADLPEARQIANARQAIVRSFPDGRVLQLSASRPGQTMASPHSDLKARRSDPRKVSSLYGSRNQKTRCPMPNAKELLERARMFDERAEQAADPISRQHYREMAAHYRALSVEHQEASRLEQEAAAS